MSNFDINNFDFNNIPEDEESIELLKQIQQFKDQNLTNNIDFEKAEQERLEIEAKNLQNEEKEEKSETLKKEKYNSNKNVEDDEEMSL